MLTLVSLLFVHLQESPYTETKQSYKQREKHLNLKYKYLDDAIVQPWVKDGQRVIYPPKEWVLVAGGEVAHNKCLHLKDQ